MAFAPAPKPPSMLGYYRVLSPSCGLRVSPICLGSMSLGSAWKAFMGECNKDTSFEILDYFYESGGNFVDTANLYQNEESETWIGEWLQKTGNRDEMVIATKYTAGFRSGANSEKIKANFQGNHSKSLKLSVEASLKKLQTSYIDLLYVHSWDFTTSIPELMNSLHQLVMVGKVLYLGISDTPAWVVVKCNEYARHHGLTQFCVYQGLWSCAARDIERDILPMCIDEGMGLAPWGALGRGMFKSEEEFNAADREGRKTGPQSEKHKKIALKLDEIAKKKDTAITSIALAYVMHKSPYVFPLVGCRKVEHLKGNIEALSIELSDEEIDEIEAAEPFDIGFPMNMLFGSGAKQYSSRMTTQDMPLVTTTARLESVPKGRPIRPGTGARHPELQGK